MEYGRGARSLWVDGTYSQCVNKTFLAYLLDTCNPESPTFVADVDTSLYTTVDIYRNPPGYTMMLCDTVHGFIVREAGKRSEIASL